MVWLEIPKSFGRHDHGWKCQQLFLRNTQWRHHKNGWRQKKDLLVSTYKQLEMSPGVKISSVVTGTPAACLAFL